MNPRGVKLLIKLYQIRSLKDYIGQVFHIWICSIIRIQQLKLNKFLYFYLLQLFFLVFLVHVAQIKQSELEGVIKLQQKD